MSKTNTIKSLLETIRVRIDEEGKKKLPINEVQNASDVNEIQDLIGNVQEFTDQLKENFTNSKNKSKLLLKQFQDLGLIIEG